MSDVQLKRNREILRLNRQGIGYQQLSKKYGISCARIQQICERERKREKEGYTDFPELRQAIDELGARSNMYTRIITRLRWKGYLHHGKWRYMTEEQMLEIRNFGPKCVEILKRTQEIAKSK